MADKLTGQGIVEWCKDNKHPIGLTLEIGENVPADVRKRLMERKTDIIEAFCAERVIDMVRELRTAQESRRENAKELPAEPNPPKEETPPDGSMF